MHGPDTPSPTAVGWPARLCAAATVGYTGVLVWATHHPKPESIVGTNPPSDKLLHVSAYAVLGGLVALTLFAARRLSLRGGLAAAASLAVFAALDEATQPLPWFRRMADPIDWVFDVAGIALGIGAIVALTAAARALSNLAWGPGSRPDSPT